MKEFEIWMEGFAATGQRGGASLVTKSFGNTFDEAVINYMNTNENHGIYENGRNRYTSEEAYINRRSNWNIWACNLFDNAQEARKSFG